MTHVFKKILERVLQKYLAPYIEGISKEGFDLLKGDLCLHDLAIKPEAFEFLQRSGVLLRSGQIGSLRIQVPWRQIADAKISIELETLTVFIARIQGEIPSVDAILEQYRRAKRSRVEAKTAELAEIVENIGKEKTPGYIKQWMLRLVQNIHITVSGNIMVQCSDTKRDFSGGLLLKNLIIYNGNSSDTGDEAEPIQQVAGEQQKLIEVNDIAVFVSAEGGAPRYLLEPTSLKMRIDHEAEELDVKLELLNRAEHCSRVLAISRVVLCHLIAVAQELLAWHRHTMDVVAQHCRDVKTDEASLQGETYQEYTSLYRHKLLGLTENEERLIIIEEAVKPRHLAHWRLEVQKELQKRSTRLSHKQTWASFLVSGREGDPPVEKDWEAIVQQVREELSHLAELDRPKTVNFAVNIARIGLQLYDDGSALPSPSNLAQGAGGESTAIQNMTYADLRAHLETEDFSGAIIHDVHLQLKDSRISFCLTPSVIADREHAEWSLGLWFGRAEVLCDNENALEFQGSAAESEGGDSARVPKEVELCGRIREDGTELVTVRLHSSPIQLRVSPGMVAIVTDLVSFEIPAPPVHHLDVPQHVPAKKRTYSRVDEWHDELSQWTNEAAERQAERAKESSLVFHIDIDIAAPQLTIFDGARNQIHVNFGRFHLISDDVMHAKCFNLRLDLSDTQINCMLDRGTAFEKSCLPVLEPISLSIGLRGHEPEASRTGSDPSLDVSLDVMLRQLHLKIHPKVAQLVAGLPEAYLSVLNVPGKPVSQPNVPAEDEDDLSPLAISSSKPSQATRANSGGAWWLAFTVHVSATVQLVSLSLFDIDNSEVARIDAGNLQGKHCNFTSGEFSSDVSLQHFIVVVSQHTLVQLRQLSSKSVQPALHVHAEKGVAPPTKLSVTLLPVVLEWRRPVVTLLVAPLAACRLSSNHLRRGSHEVEIKDITDPADATSGGRHSVKHVPQDQPRRSFAFSDESWEVAQNGLAADEGIPLPSLQVELKAAEGSHEAPSLVVEGTFGGLIIQLHRGKDEQAELCPAWKGTTSYPLIELHAEELVIHFENFSNDESRGSVSLKNCSMMYDSHCIVSPWLSTANVFESDIKVYLPPEKGGPIHSTCIKGFIRKISVVHFQKHLDSFLQYLLCNIMETLQQQDTTKEVPVSTQATVDVAAGAQKGVLLWSFFIESPVLHGAQDECVLKQSPAWLFQYRRTKRTNTTGAYAPEMSDAESTDSFESTVEHPTPIVDRLTQYIVAFPGSIQARNSFNRKNPDAFMCWITFKQCHFDTVDRHGPASGRLLDKFDWDLGVRIDSEPNEPMHVSLGLHFGPIDLSISQAQLTLILNFVNENILYSSYFPEVVAEAPKGAKAVVLPTLVKRTLPGRWQQLAGVREEDARDGGDGGSDGDSRDGDRDDDDDREANVCFESQRINLRFDYDAIKMKICCSSASTGVEDTPLLRLAMGHMRMTFDSVHYYGGKRMLFQYGLFFNSILAEDIRPPEFCASTHFRKLLELHMEGDFTGPRGPDTWVFLPNREQGSEPYVPPKVAFLLLFTRESHESSTFCVELRRPRAFLLLQLVTDASEVFSLGFASSSWTLFPGPPPPSKDSPLYDMPSNSDIPPDVSFRQCFKVENAILCAATRIEDAAAPVLEAITSIDVDIISEGRDNPTTRIHHMIVSDLIIRCSVPCATSDQGCYPNEGGSPSSAPALRQSPHATFVQLCQLSRLHVGGLYKQVPVPVCDLSMEIKPLSVRLTTSDVPQLLAAIQDIGADGGKNKSMVATLLPQTGRPTGNGAVGGPDVAGDAGPPNLTLPRNFTGKVGILHLRVVGISGAKVANPGKLWVTAQCGDYGEEVVVPWDQQFKLAVPTMHSSDSARRGVGDGPMLQLTLQCPGETGSAKRLGFLRFPVELCAGAGLKCSRSLRVTGERAGKGNASPELDFEAHYAPGSVEESVAMGIAELSAPVQDLDDFLALPITLDDFLHEPVPALPAATPQTRTRERRASSWIQPQPRQDNQSPVSVRLLASCEGIEASFLDDCRAKMLPVLQFSFRVQSAQDDNRASMDSDSLVTDSCSSGRTKASGMEVRWNPWEATQDQEHDHQQLGFSVKMLDCNIGIKYLNARAGCWEPFLERWAFDVFFNMFEDALGVPIGKSSFFRSAPSLSGEDPAAAQPAGVLTELTLVSFTALNVNITPQLCVLGTWLLDNQAEYIAHFKGESLATGSVDSAGGMRYRLLNLTSTPVRLALVCAGRAKSLSGDGFAKIQGIPSGTDRAALQWHTFGPCSHEVSLDALLGNRSAEEWRESADETLACLVALAPSQRPEGGKKVRGEGAQATSSKGEADLTQGTPDGVHILLSSTCDGLLPLPNAQNDLMAYAVCEVLAPHPSHKLMLISSRLRIFNHTDMPLEVRACVPAEGHALQPPATPQQGSALAAPLDVLPTWLALPAEVASMLHTVPCHASGQDMTGPELVRAMSSPSTWARPARASFSIVEAAEASPRERAPPDDAEDVHQLPPQQFCAIPLAEASMATAMQFRFPGMKSWSNCVPLDARGESWDMVLVPSTDSLPWRFHTHLKSTRLSCLASDDHAMLGLHVCAPVQLINASPVRLSFCFTSLSGREAAAGAMHVVEVDPFSADDLPRQVDPNEKVGLSLMVADDTVDVLSPLAAATPRTGAPEPMAPSQIVPCVFSNSAVGEELVSVPLTREGSEGPSLAFTIGCGLACRVSCSRWLVDRTGLGLRVIRSSKAPVASTTPLAQVDGHITLLDDAPREALASFHYHLALRDGADSNWAAVGAVQLPDHIGDITYATLERWAHSSAPPHPTEDPLQQYPVHVCLRAERVCTELTFGANCQVIVVLPQVILYNQIPDDVLVVRAANDPMTERLVEASSSASVLRWRSHAVDCSGLALQFRPLKLDPAVRWSTPIWLTAGQALGAFAIALSPNVEASPNRNPPAQRVFAVEVAERSGVMCVTVVRGSGYELQNFSLLADKVAIVPSGQANHQESYVAEEFCARSCETVEFAWTSINNNSGLGLKLWWASGPGNSVFHSRVPDIRRPGRRAVFPAPGGWQAIVVETGSTGDVSWLRVQDLLWLRPGASMPGRAGKGMPQGPAQLKVGLSLSHLGVSLVSERCKHELLYLELRQIDAILQMWEDVRNVELVVSDIQADNQLLNCPDPVILANRGEQGSPCLRCRIVQPLPTSCRKLTLHTLEIQVDTLELSINEAFRLEIVQTINDMLSMVLSSKGVTKEQLESWRMAPLQDDFGAPPPVPMQIAIDRFMFHGLQVRLWASTTIPLALRGLIGDELVVQGAKLELDPELFDDFNCAAPTLFGTLLRHYWYNLLRSLASMLGKSSLLKKVKLPFRWGRHVVQQGMMGLNFSVKRAIEVLEACTLDEQYVQRKKRQRERQRQEVFNLRQGFSAAAVHLAEGLWHIGDVVREPLAGARQGGLTGFLVGGAKGVLGVAVKPAIEASLGARVVVRAMISKLGPPRVFERRVVLRRRPPRVMYRAGAIREYDEVAALYSLEIVTAEFAQGCSAKDQAAIEHARYGVTDHIVVKKTGAPPYTKNLVLLVCPAQLLLIDLRGGDEHSTISVRWVSPLAGFRGARASSHGVVVWAEDVLEKWSDYGGGMFTKKSRTPAMRGLITHQIPCDDPHVIQDICRMLRPLQTLQVEKV